jgi:hypothetical protein
VPAIAADDQVSAEGLDGFEEGCGCGREVVGEAFLAVVVEDAQEEGPGVQVHTGVESGVRGVWKKRRKASGSGVCQGRRRGAPQAWHVRAFLSIQALHPTGPA